MRRLAALLLLAALVGAAAAQTGKDGAWAQLSPAQKEILAPLARDWASIDAPRQKKWLAMAERFPSMPADERARIKDRMADWGRLSTTERGRARLQFLEARQLPADERQAKWQEYQALSGAQRQALAAQAKPANRVAAAAEAPSNSKQNVVPAQPLAARPPTKPVTGTAVQVRPGATTTSIATRTAPPAHHQPGLPKIAATPGFVDPATLLPQRGPQGAAVQAAASQPTRQP
jgi:hypothetical protein